MNTVLTMTAVYILAVLVVVFSSGSYSMIQVNAQQIHRGTIQEVPLTSIAPGCKDLKARMANDTADQFYAGLFKEFDCADVLARVP